MLRPSRTVGVARHPKESAHTIWMLQERKGRSPKGRDVLKFRAKFDIGVGSVYRDSEMIDELCRHRVREDVEAHSALTAGGITNSATS